MRNAADTLYSNKKEFIILVLEVIICAICTPPTIDKTFKGSMLNGEFMYSLDGMVMVLTLVKSYLLVRMFYSISDFQINEENKLHFQKHNYFPTVSFIFNAEIKSIPFMILCCVFVLLDLYIGLILFYSERSFV